jgi:phospholipid/cholesterol/gamma-HCH transport system ATP-binding protein
MTDVAIRLERVTKSFGGTRVLDEVSFDVRRGTAFCILGRSGTGKSVTLKHIIGLMKPDEGRIFVDGEEITQLAGRELSRLRVRMGFLFQNAALFDSIRWARTSPSRCAATPTFPIGRYAGARSRNWPMWGWRAITTGCRLSFPGGCASGPGSREPWRSIPRASRRRAERRPRPDHASEIDALLVSRQAEGQATLVVVTHNIPSARAVADRTGDAAPGQADRARARQLSSIGASTSSYAVSCDRKELDRDAVDAARRAWGCSSCWG